MYTKEELKNLHLYDFGIYLELEPDDEEKAQLEQNIQVALQSGQIYLEDAIEDALDGVDVDFPYIKPVGCSIKWNKKFA